MKHHSLVLRAHRHEGVDGVHVVVVVVVLLVLVVVKSTCNDTR